MHFENRNDIHKEKKENNLRKIEDMMYKDCSFKPTLSTIEQQTRKQLKKHVMNMHYNNMSVVQKERLMKNNDEAEISINADLEAMQA